MRSSIGWLAVAVACICAVPARAEETSRPERKRGTYQAQRAGWLMGMYVGEEAAKPYPFVTEVDPKSEARRKGIRPGDELIRFEDQETRPLARLFDEVQRLRPGKRVTLWVRRGGQTLRFELSVPRPESQAARADDEKSAEKDEDAKKSEKEQKKKKDRPIVIKPIPAPER